MSTKPRIRHTIGDSVLTTVRKWTLGKANNDKQTKYIRIQFNHFITVTLWLSDKAIARSMETLELMGFKGASLSDLQFSDALNTTDEFAVTIESEREYEGKTYYEGSWINNPNATGFDSKSKDLVSEFDIDTRAYIADAKDMSSPAASETAQDAFTPGVNNSFTADDIPF